MKGRATLFLARYGSAVLVLGAIIGVQSLLLAYSIRISFTVPIILGLVATAWYAGLGPGLFLAVLIAGVSAISDRTTVDETTIQWITRHVSNLGLLIFIAFVIAERKLVSGMMSASEERARLESEEQFRIFFELANVGMVVIAPDDRIIEVNEEISSLLGYSKSELRSMPWTSLTHEDDKALDPANFGKILRGEAEAHIVEKRLVKKDGSTLYGNISIRAFREPDGPLRSIIAVVQDVTTKAMAEQALRSSEERYRDLIENAHDIIYTHDLQGNYTSVNAAVEYITGYTTDEAMLMNIRDTVVPEQLPRVEDMIKRKLQGERVTNYELEIRAKDGRTITMEVNTRIVYKDGEPVGIQGIARDITGRKRLEEQLLQAQKLESVGRLAGGIAHDFNNMLTAINGYSDLALRKMTPDDPGRNYIEEIKKAGERSALLTNQLLAFSRRQILHPQMIKINDVVHDTMNLLQRLIGEDIDLVTELKPNVGSIKFDPGQLSQVLMNLAVNARDAMPEGGQLTIETSNIFIDPNYASTHIGLLPGAYVLLSMSDTGIGMSPDVQEQIFEPFFTTKGIGKGTGLGLATVYGIVRQSGGGIFVYSEEGHGSTFKIYIPRVAEDHPNDAKADIARKLAVGSETILLVEDEDLVRSLSRQVLEACGYQVIEARDGLEALEFLETEIGTVDLLITDVIMPRMGGRELAEKLRSSNSDLPILFASGYTDEAVVRHGVLDNNLNFIQKPFTLDDVARKVRDLLDASQSK
ncbi:MAG: PAS domain S-box protein [Acidobacteria bacterium]|nr:PAS domain S-box protein [Acidobacteriota bacterium]